MPFILELPLQEVDVLLDVLLLLVPLDPTTGGVATGKNKLPEL